MLATECCFDGLGLIPRCDRFADTGRHVRLQQRLGSSGQCESGKSGQGIPGEPRTVGILSGRLAHTGQLRPYPGRSSQGVYVERLIAGVLVRLRKATRADELWKRNLFADVDLRLPLLVNALPSRLELASSRGWQLLTFLTGQMELVVQPEPANLSAFA